MLTFPLDLTLNCCHGIIMVFQVMESWKIGKIENWKVKELIFEVDLTLHCCHFFLTSSRKIFPQQSNKTFLMFFSSFRSTHGSKKCGGDFFPGLPLQVYAVYTPWGSVENQLFSCSVL